MTRWVRHSLRPLRYALLCHAPDLQTEPFPQLGDGRCSLRCLLPSRRRRRRRCLSTGGAAAAPAVASCSCVWIAPSQHHKPRCLLQQASRDSAKSTSAKGNDRAAGPADGCNEPR
eukprot:COSAG06_NODE_2480_length_6788_cov_3.392084_10_plen_115_part_00